ncbi:Zinc finger domain-containing protein, CCCH-type [Metarhizium robertsii ARSEF 23]|uniref:Zinc finger domain-containing protein, CCCH-type n=1 Tax=Metarhizium robertsii (strain ARSEF 23 / ATCC MYA-3075) TaxID=655844 RepID=E9EJ84_METRA|nr:Zinc finger domain-containing protein, CCCH-type [Metarhizium robertsii ARSEF 23]EFZ03770.2 Zinc finger domain-containing protein, CCCH-type [Metarhizium robertsii ARSEF 23]
MSQHGYGYVPPDGYNLHQGFPHTSQPAYTPALNTLIAASQGQPSIPENASGPSYGHNLIPGLGLGTHTVGSTQHGSWSHGHPPSWQVESLSHQSSQENTQVLPKSQPVTSIPGLSGTPAKPLEDGGVSEDGELEDVYEPMETKQDAAGTSQTHQQRQVGYEPVDGRERSGSYSPYLSPHEISQPGDGLLDYFTGDKLIASEVASSAPIDVRDVLPPTPSQTKSMNHSDLEASKKQAKDAILRLWPLNIRFNNYVSEGVDEALLKSLFKDLGLNFTEATRMTSEPEEKESATSDGTSISKALAVETTKPVLAKPKPAVVDASESRKDRIARLLAAKGSKQGTAPASLPADDAVAPKSAKAVATDVKPTLTQSEKSKLLQQKMEALKKAREALKQLKPTPVDDKNGFSKGDSTLEAFFKTTSHDGSNAPRNDASATVIPGLSWSPSKQATSPPQTMQQPTTTLQAVDPSQLRPAPAFDQNTESRPFLINVSEAEEEEDGDEEMELDSPSRPETPSDMPNPPHQQDAMLRDVQAIPDFSIPRQLRSPASASTPLRSASRNNGSDLESMNKQIEEMKRKIAEAEARKKAKNSRQGSPVLSQLNDSSFEDGCDTAGRPVAPPRFYGELGHEARTALGTSLEQRSRSRAASERLPLIEARRRKQRLKLKALQSEIARIEQELEEDMLEEERLKGEILSSDSDNEMDTSAPVDLSDSDESEQPAARSSEQNQAPEQPDDVPDVDDEASFPSRDLPAAGESSAGVAAPNLSNEDIMSTTILPESNKMNTETFPNVPQSSSLHSDSAEDVNMEDAGYSADEDVEENSEGDYEPPEANSSAVASNNDFLEQDSAMLSQTEEVVEASPVTLGATAAFPGDPALPEPGSANEDGKLIAPKTSFVPYETPLQYFRAYRFHPSFNQDVAGGLRSITYSNKIDIKKELCPDELAGQQCPRGSQCEFQHFETMQAPEAWLELGTDSPNWTDDQILLQLGAADHYDEEQKQKYIAGLKQLLTDFRARKVKDFNTISQGIVEFRARFIGDGTKILPLGSISL